MTDNLIPHEKPSRPNKAIKDKKKYQKPTFRYERVFETQALSCGKIGPAQGTCHGASTKTS